MISPFFFHSMIDEDYAWELQFFQKYRDLKDGLDIFNVEMNWDKYMADHNPKFIFSLKLINIIIFEFIIYNIWHTDNPRSPYFGMDDDAPNYEKDNHPSTSDVTVIFHSRRNFYHGRPIYWYEFRTQIDGFDFTDLIPQHFLNVPFTVFYEYGGTHEEALKELTSEGFTNIIEGDEL